jgi:isopenicillin N synthase-like dioxygenase
LVRKFRVGPWSSADQRPTSALLQENVWPPEVWDGATSFRAVVEEYYTSIRAVSKQIVHAICDALVLKNPELKASLQPLMRQGESTSEDSPDQSTCILTMLGYQVGSRHRGKEGSKGPLVAAHTDVGVVTVLIFDGGTCAALQRTDGNGGWIDVALPDPLLGDDPIFVVNVADCLSDLTGGRLPSTVHRVVAKPGTTPRHCCAMFVGLEPDAMLEINGEPTSYEAWRKQRIEKAKQARTGNEKPTEQG